MKRLVYIFIIFAALVSCKKQHFSPEGPTDVRIRNISDQVFYDLTVTSSEKEGDTYIFGSLSNGNTTDYHRFQKAYPKAEITTSIMINGSAQIFSTGDVDFTYMQYMGQDLVTYEVYISDLNNHKLEISKVIPDAQLVLK